MPKVKLPIGFLPELWTSLVYTPKSLISPLEPIWAARLLMVSSAWVPMLYGFRVTKRLLYQRVLPYDWPNKTAWLLPLPLHTSAWPGFAHTSLGRQTSKCHSGHQCAFLLSTVCSDLFLFTYSTCVRDGENRLVHMVVMTSI